MRKNGILLLAAVLVSASAAAETTGPVVVTATRTPITADDALASVSVLTRKDFDDRNPADLSDLLSTLPGVQMDNSGGPGKQTALSVRGTKRVLVLVDGVRLESATTGTPAVQHIPLSRVQRIEVVRGPRSTLYGADAVGGVIQIFTRDSGSYVTAGAGSNSTRSLDAGVSRRGDRGGVSVNASTYATDGFDAQTTGNPDADGYRNDSVNMQGDYRVTDRVKVSANALRTSGHSEFDGLQTQEDSTEQVLGGHLDWQATQRWHTRLSVGQSLDDSDNREGGGGRFVTRRNSASWQNDVYWNADNVTTLGVDTYRDRVTSTTAYTETSRRNTGVFLQHQWYGERTDLLVGGRWDDNEAYGENTTGQVSGGYRLTDDLRAYASWATAFKAPTFNELYYPGYGNPDLKPQESENIEAGLKGGGAVTWTASVFRNRVDDFIVIGSDGVSRNIDQADIRGVELQAATVVRGFHLQGNLTLLDPPEAQDGDRLYRRARRTATASVGHAIGPVHVTAQAQYVGDRRDLDFSTYPARAVTLDHYTTLSLSARWAFLPDWSLTARVDNLTDADYQSVYGYNTAGRTVFASVSWQPSR